jgi:hypothetical protein
MNWICNLLSRWDGEAKESEPMHETEVFFDSDVIYDLAPFDWDEKGTSGSGISVFSQPESVVVGRTEDNRVKSLRFTYHHNGDALEDVPLDDLHPAVGLKYARNQLHVHSVYLSQPGRRNEVLAVAKRIRDAAKGMEPTRQAFSHRMIADTIEYYVSDIVGESPKRVPIEHIFAGHEVAGYFYEDDDYRYEDGEAFSVKMKNGCVVDVWKDEDDPEGGFRVMVDRSFDRRYRKWQDVLEKTKQLVEAFDE